MGDRTGGREPKLSSLKKSKKNPGAPASRTKTVAKSIPTSSTTLPAPIPSRDGLYFDSAVALLSRQFDRDRDRVITRAQQDNLCGFIVWFSDIEKQSSLADICKANTAFCYFITGVHPDNIERTNKKSHDQWIEKVEELARKPECVGILSGINMSRDIGTHFAQESLLRASCGLATKLLLPLIVHAPNPVSLEKAIEILKEEKFVSDGSNDSITDNDRRALLLDPITASGCDSLKLTSAIECGFVFLVSGVGLTDEDATIRHKAKECVQAIPKSHILSCTDSPWRTPQNITDPYLRTLRNEPCNVMFVNEAIADAFDIKDKTEVEQFSKLLRNNAFEVFGLNVTDIGNDPSSTLITELSTVSLTAAAASTDTNIAVDAIANHPQTQLQPQSQGDDDSTLIQATEELKLQGKLSNNQNESVLTSASTSSLVINDKVSDSHQHQHDEEDNEEKEADDDENESDINSIENDTPVASYYGCIKCRAQLFLEKDTLKHGLDTSKTVFKVGEEGLCKSVVFLSCSGRKDLIQKTLLTVKGNERINNNSSVECSVCNCKIGKFHIEVAYCACGATMQGPVVRLLTSKMDYFDLNLDQSTLIERAKQEVDEVILNNEDEAATEYALHDTMHKKKINKNLKVPVRLGGGNFSNFRNKSFIPNATRVLAAAAATAVTGTGAGVGAGGGGKGKKSSMNSSSGGNTTNSVYNTSEEEYDEANPDDDHDGDEEDDTRPVSVKQPSLPTTDDADDAEEDEVDD